MSNTYGTLSLQVKRYFSSNTSLYNVVQGQPTQAAQLQTEIDLAILAAANNARRFAEMRHDFAVNDVVGRATLVGGVPLDLDSVTLDTSYGVGEVSFKSLRAVHVVDVASNVSQPIRVVSRQTEVIALMKKQQLGVTDRYRDDNAVSDSNMVAIINGRKLTVQPFSDTTSIAIAIDGNRWSDDYTVDDDTDYFLQKGFEFMQWQCIVELNNMLLKFVPRQEGTLAPPTQARDIALENLIMSDSFSVAGNIYHDL